MFDMMFLNLVSIFNFKNVKINPVDENVVSLNASLTLTLRMCFTCLVEKP